MHTDSDIILPHPRQRYALDPACTPSRIYKGTYTQHTWKLFQAQHPHLQDICIPNNIYGILPSLQHTQYPKFQRIKPRCHILYYMGNIDLLHAAILAVVGPRKTSTYGQRLLQHLFEHLPSYNMVTISGLAEGVDQTTHAYCIEKTSLLLR